MRSKVSVIVPVYNTKEFLRECVESVCAQSYQNIELVLVDDGSTDGSGDLCDTLAQTHTDATHAILVLHKENGGLADARNYGMLHASGDYLLFLDSDDYYLSAFALERLMEQAIESESDVLCFNYTRNKNLTPERSYPAAFTSDLSALITSNVYTSSACLKLIKKEILCAQNIGFIKGQHSEDILFSGKLLMNPAHKICFLNQVIYFYRVRETSITNTLKLNHILDTIDILHTLEACAGVCSAKQTPVSDDAGNLLAYTAFQYATLLINMHLCAERLSAATRAEIFSMRYLLQYHPTGVVKLIYLSTKCIGMRATSFLLSIAFKGKQVLNR